jgi:hypothetical protein
MLGYSPSLNRNTVKDRFENISYLIGNFDLVVYGPFQQSLGWVKTGIGSSSFSYKNSFITEIVEVIKGNTTFTLNNTLALDLENDTFKLLTLGNNTGQMEIFKGVIFDSILTFCNTESEMKINKGENNSFCTKLFYKRISAFENELVVGSSKDGGKTWFPYSKTVYKRKLTL